MYKSTVDNIFSPPPSGQVRSYSHRSAFEFWKRGYYLHHFGPNSDEDYLRRQMRQYLPNQVVEDHINGTRPLMTRTEMFNYWVRIMLEEQNRGNTPNE